MIRSSPLARHLSQFIPIIELHFATKSPFSLSQEVRGHQKVTSQNPEGTQEALSKYARDLTAAAAEGKLDPVSTAVYLQGISVSCEI